MSDQLKATQASPDYHMPEYEETNYINAHTAINTNTNARKSPAGL